MGVPTCWTRRRAPGVTPGGASSKGYNNASAPGWYPTETFTVADCR